MENSNSFTIDSDILEIPKVSIALDRELRVHGFSEEDILDSQLAVEEAITNVIVHGYEKKAGKIVITCRITHGFAEVQIEDSAPPFNPLSIPNPDISVNIEERKIGGLGIFLIRQVMDDIVYRYEDGKNILVMVKKKKV
ncbi:MAG: ATP-binding protein [Methanoregula sp.]|nr:ATP-binding protein [Methanoregula sp.]